MHSEAVARPIGESDIPSEHSGLGAPPPPANLASAVTSCSSLQQHRPALGINELLSFVDPPADGDTVDEHLDFIRDPYLRRYAPAAGPELTVSHSREDAEFPTWKDVERADEAVQKTVHELRGAVLTRLRNPRKASAADIYDIYRQLPATRMAYIPANLRHQLLKALGMVEKKDAQSMLRYFAVVADVKDSGFSLWRAEWNAAMSFASRYVGSSTASETEAAVNLWREMEQDAGIRGNEVTFNILFDVASKAGNFTLAEMVYQEMEKRGLRFNRYHHVSLIHFFGLKMDSDGVRAAYQEMVNAGEIIDVVVLNCVMVGFLRCGEEDAAERVYTRMLHSGVRQPTDTPSKETATAAEGGPKDPASALSPLPAVPANRSVSAAAIAGTVPDMTNFASQKVMTRVLMMLAKVSKGDGGLRAGFQRLMPTQPNLSTYRILINHYAVRLSDLSAVTRYLNDMKTLNIPLHGAIFLALFKGFSLHGGRVGTGAEWSEQRLRSIWAALLKALDDGAEGLYISTWLVVWALRAFDRCSTPEMVFKAYNSLSSRWEPSEADADFTIGFLHNLLRNRHDGVPRSSRDGNSRFSGGRSSMIGQLGSRAFG